MNKARIKKIVFLCVVLLLTVRLVTYSFKEQVNVVEQPVKTFEVSQEDIISSGKEITIKSFEHIDEVNWISEDLLRIKGIIDTVEDEYVFDTKNNELLKLKSSEDAQSIPGYEIITTIDEYGILALKDHSIGLIKDGNFQVILDNIGFEGINRYQLSEDKSKLLAYNGKKDTIVTYNFKKKFYKTINTKITDAMISNFDEVFQLSPIGGYVSVAYEGEVVEESYFRLYGADSGRLYAEDVYGVALSWAPDDSKLCYYYAKEAMATANGMDGLDYSASRIGYYDVNKKKIDYLETLQSTGDAISKIYWTNQTISFLTGHVEDQKMLSSLVTYDFNEDQYNAYRIDKTVEMTTKIDVLNDVDGVILLLDHETGYVVLNVPKTGEEVVQLDEIVAFDTLETKNVFYFERNGAFITADTEKLTISNGRSQGFIQLLNNDYIVIPNNDMSSVSVWIKQGHEIKILSTN